MKRIELNYITEELLVDISGRCWLAADAAETGGMKDVHNMRDVVDDGNREIILNIMSRVMYESMNILYPFCKTPIKTLRKTVSDDNRTEEAEVYVITLNFPYERSETEVQEMKRCIHDYVVYKCFAEWLALTMPESQWQVWEQKAQEVRDRLTTVLVLPLRPRTVRVRPYFY